MAGTTSARPLKRLRSVVRRVHLLMGLSLGLVLALAGMTGSALVFYVEIDRVAHRALWVTGAEEPRSWEAALQTLRRAYPDKQGPWRFEVRGDGGPIPARYYNPPETAGRDFAPMLVWLPPDGSRVLRRAYWGETAMTWIYDLHYQLLLGKTGGVVMAWAGVAALLLLMSGLWAWWPRPGGALKAFRVKRNASQIRRLYDLHKTAGLSAVLILLVLVVTGAALGLPKETDHVLSSTLGSPAVATIPTPEWSGGRVSVDRALQAARASVPSGRLAWIEAPGMNAGFYRFRFQMEGDPSRRFPHSHVFVHPTTGEGIEVFDVREYGASTAIKNWLHPLHDGSAAGLPGRLAICAVGLAPALLFVTGLLRWRRRRMARKAAP